MSEITFKDLSTGDRFEYLGKLYMKTCHGINISAKNNAVIIAGESRGYFETFPQNQNNIKRISGKLQIIQNYDK